MRIRALIKALGGPTVVAEALRLKIARVGNWCLRNELPPEHHIAIWRLAIAKGVRWVPPGAEGLQIPAPEPPAPKRTKRATPESTPPSPADVAA
jgi:hypothetical protein